MTAESGRRFSATASAPRSPSTASSSVPMDAVLVELKTVWRDGTSHLLFEPIEFMEQLAAIIPRPTINLVLSYGATCAPSARPDAPPNPRSFAHSGSRRSFYECHYIARGSIAGCGKTAYLSPPPS